MIGLVLVMHGALGPAFLEALVHVVGAQKQVACLSIAPGDTVEKRLPDIEAMVRCVDLGEGTIIVTDVAGGTPCQIATSMLKHKNVRVVAGINLPMLIKLVRGRRKYGLDDIVDRARDAGRVHYYCDAAQPAEAMDSGIWVGETKTLSAEVMIVNIKGLHTRASAKFVKCAERFDAEIKVSRDGETVGGTSIMGLLMLGAAKGSSISIVTEGREAAAALAALITLVRNGFDENDDDE